MRLKPGVIVNDESIAALRAELTRAENFRGQGTLPGYVHQYMLWTDETERMLSNVLRPDDIASLVLTPQYRAIPTLDPPAAANIAISREIERFIARLSFWIDSLDVDRQRWAGTEQLVVPDTNVFLHGPPVEDIDWHELLGHSESERQTAIRVVVLLLVIDELDKLKDRGQDKIRTRARVTLRVLEDMWRTAAPQPQAAMGSADAGAGAVTIEVLLDDLAHERLPDTDSEIVDRAAFLQELTGREVTIITGDVGMALRARAAGVGTCLTAFDD
jgi:PIN domain